MSYRISEEKISEIKNATDIVDVVSEVVQLRKAGKNFLGLCPFHSEKTPSFTVSPDKQIFHCFGCGEGGNVISFLMKHERLTFPEALRGLARRNNISIPDAGLSENEKKRYFEKESLFDIHKMAAKFYQDMLESRGTGQKAMAYLTQRGLSGETIREFHIGFAPDAWSRLFDFLITKKVPAHLIEKAGLVIAKKENNGFYDRFRNRVIFPIYNIGEQVVGFGGRVMGEGLPKYLNSPETPLYDKGRLLYGLHRAKYSCRRTETVYVVEGYLDCLTLIQHGVENTVATLGTALTAEHVRILRGFARKIILVFDSDAAGIQAATRSISLFLDQNVDARILVLPKGNDPDVYVRENGVDRFLALSSNAYSIIAFIIDNAVKKHGLSIEGKVEVVNDLMETLGAMDDPVAISLYVKAIAERVDIDESAIAAKLNAFRKSRGIKNQNRYTKGAMGSNSPSGKGTAGEKNHGGMQTERQIIAMMLQFPDILTDIKQHNVIDYFKDPLLKAIGVIIVNYTDITSHFISDIMNVLENDQQKNVVAALSIQNEGWNVEGCRKLITRFLLTIRAGKEKTLVDAIKTAEKENDFELLAKLLDRKQKNAIHMERQKMTMIRKA